MMKWNFKCKNVFFSLLVMFLSLYSFSSQALNTEIRKFYFTGMRGVDFIESTPDPQGSLNTGLTISYARQPFEFSTATGTSPVVDDLLTFQLGASYSLSDRVAIAIGVPLHLSDHIISVGTTNRETKFNFGDLMVAGLINIITRDGESSHWGLGVAPFITLPTGRVSDFVGNDSITGGFIATVDADLNGHFFGINLGLRARSTENFTNLSVASEFLYTVFYQHYISKEWQLDGFFELNGSTVLKDFMSKENTHPIEGLVGLTKKFGRDGQFTAKVAGGFGFDAGYGASDYRILSQINYQTKLALKKRSGSNEASRMMGIEKRLKELTIYYPTAGSEVDSYYHQKIAKIAGILKNNPDLGPLYIVSHTDDVGSQKVNQNLSEKRAQEAYEAIVAQGLDSKFIVWLGLGESVPVVSNSSDANRALNRRTLFTFAKPRQLGENSSKTWGINRVTGKRSDSYTEVLKELDRRRALGESTHVMRKYKDSSEVVVDGDETVIKTKDKPTAPSQNIRNQPRSKTYFEDRPQAEKTP